MKFTYPGQRSKMALGVGGKKSQSLVVSVSFSVKALGRPLCMTKDRKRDDWVPGSGFRQPRS